MSTRILITGCRQWQPHAIVKDLLFRLRNRHGHALVIVHGAAKGVDRTFEHSAQFYGIMTEPHPADWEKHGKAAGPIRNQEMVEAGAKACIAVHRDLKSSKGTKDCVNRAIRAGIPTWWVDEVQEYHRLEEGWDA